ncbi:MAG: citrate lyase [Sphingomonas bacterium]|nr:citrate lyase [Sphingomonas bacterium]
MRMTEPLAARSLLFAPGDSPRKLEKAGLSAADLVIIDLEDAVAESAKPAARIAVAQHLKTTHRRQPHWVRINPLDTPHALPDLGAIVASRPDGVMLPKATRADADVLNRYLEALETAAGLPIGKIAVAVLATETAAGVFDVGNYAGCPRLAALSWGAEDSATALGATSNRDDDGEYDFPYQVFRTLCLTGAAAAGVSAIETIHGDFRDAEGLDKMARKARRAGFRGMLAIHPDQVPVINAAFSPSAEEIAHAEAIVAAFAANPGAGTVGLDGAMLDMPHLKRAQAVLAMRR